MANHLYGYNPSNYGSGGGASSFPSLYSPKSGADAYNPSDSSLYGASRVLGPNPERGSSMFSQSDILRYGGADIGGSYPMGLAGRVSGASHLTSQSSWPGIDGGAHDPLGAGIKRPPESLYHQTLLGTHNMIGQIEAWFSSNPLAKRPRFESGSTLPIYPQRPGEKDCAHYMLTRTCKFADTCKFDHPIWVPEGGITDWKEVPLVPLTETLPERPGEPDCPYFLKTQKCKFGFKCKFNHPKEQMVTAEVQEGTVFSALPERPSEPPCAFYLKTGKCKFGTSCKFHHPKDIQQPSAGQDYATDGQSESAPGNDETIGLVQQAKPNFAPASLHNSKGLPIRPAHTELSISREEFEKLKEEFKVTKEHMVQYKSIAQVNEAALKQMETSHENFKNEADKVRTSLEAEISSYRERVKELEIECSLKSKDAASAVANTESSIASAVSEIDLLKEELSVKKSEIEAAETQISLLTKDLEEEHKKWRDAQTNYERQADKVRTSLEAEISSYRERVKELEIECSLKSKEAASAVANTESSIASAVSEIDLLKEELSVKKSEIEAAETQISLLTKDLEEEHKKWRDAQTNYERQADKVRTSLEAEISSYRERVKELEIECSLKSKEAASAVANTESSIASAVSEIDLLKEELSVKKSEIEAAETQISLLTKDLEEEHKKWRDAQTNYERQGEVECPFYLKTGTCKYGATCRYSHPDRYGINQPANAVIRPLFPSPAAHLSHGFVNPAASILQTIDPRLAQTPFGLTPTMYPQRPGQIECDYYMKSGKCLFAERCKYHHPIDRSASTLATNGGQEQNVKLSLAGLPRREGATHCPFYMKTGTCKYGVNCKFDHPPPAEVLAMATTSAAAAAAEGEEKAETEVEVQEQQQQQ